MAVSTAAETLLQLTAPPAAGTTAEEAHPGAVGVPYTPGQC